jgi:hypothetical protein
LKVVLPAMKQRIDVQVNIQKMNCSYNDDLSITGQSASIIVIIIQKDEKENDSGQP